MMEQKQNRQNQFHYQRRQRNKLSHAISKEGNDYILKRYRLEQNNTFKEKLNEEHNYNNVASKPKENNEEQAEEDLVIVPLDEPFQQINEDELQQPENEQPQEIYVFDDDEQELPSAPGYTEKKEEQKSDQKVEKRLSLSKELNPLKKEENGKRKPKIQLFGQLNPHGILRSNASTAQLITPSHFSVQNLGTLISSAKNHRNSVEIIDQQEHQKDIQHITKIKGVYIEEGHQSNTISIVDKKLFAISKLPSGIILRCIIKRTNSFLNMISPEYDLYLANGLKHIISTKKYPMRNRELFKFSTDPVKFSDSSLLSVMHANVNHNIYWLLDLPKKMNQMELSVIQLLVGYYRLKQTEERKFTALLPSMNQTYQLAIDYEQSFINFNNFKQQVKIQLNNLQKWDQKANNSTKNFVLADQEDPDYRYLQMKKQSDNVFELTIQHPLSPLQAMAIAMTRFDAQLV